MLVLGHDFVVLKRREIQRSGDPFAAEIFARYGSGPYEVIEYPGDCNCGHDPIQKHRPGCASRRMILATDSGPREIRVGN